MFPYYCKVCGSLDVEGINGHATNRCKGPQVVVHAESNGSSRHGVYADKEKRKEYRKTWMRKRRSDAQGQR